MRSSISPIVRTAQRLLLLAVLPAVGMLPAAPTTLASSDRPSPAALGQVLVKVQARGAHGYAAFNPKNANVTRIAAGHAARLIIYAYYSGVTAPAKVRASFFRRQGRTLILDTAGNFTVDRSGWRWFWDNIGGMLTKPGRLILRGVITAGGVTKFRETTLTVF